MKSAVRWARPVLGDGFPVWLRRAERKWTAAMAPVLVAGTTAGDHTGWRTARLTVTRTLVAVATVTHPRSTRSFVVKVPWTAAGAASLRRQAAALAVLRADPRLPSLRPVLPRCVGHGDVDGRYYWVEEALPGVPAGAVMLRRTGRAALLDAATRLIGDLHAPTREQTLLGRATVEAWVDAPLRRLETFAATRPQRDRLLDTVRGLREELTATLAGRTVTTSWIHGDFWPGNLLAAPHDGQVTGVVDWDHAEPRQLPLHDLLHLHVLARRLVRGDELGDVVIRALRQGIDETLGVPAGRVAAWLDGIPPRPALLLYWLRHILLFIDSEGDHDNPRWLRGNVERVLRTV